MAKQLKPIGNQTTYMISELRFLNAIYNNPKLLDDSSFDIDLLYHPECKSLYKALESLKSKGLSFTESAFTQEACSIDLNITDSIVRAVLDSENNTLNDNDYKQIIDNLIKAKKGRSIVESLNVLSEKLLENPTQIDELNKPIEDALRQVENDILNNETSKRLETFKESLDKYEESLKERSGGKKYLFYNPVMDRIVKNGPAPGSGGLIAASTGMGKSAFCLNLINGFINAQIPVIYYSLEMGTIDTFDRLLALRKNIPMGAIIDPKDIETYDGIVNAFEEEKEELIQNTKFRFSECAFVSLSQVESDIKAFKQEENVNYCIVVFDLLSMIKDFTILENGMNFAQGIEVAINVLNGLAKKHNFHYVAVLQLNRKIEDGQISDLDDIEKFRPTRNAIKNSNAFLERCRWNIGLFRPKYFAEQYLDKSVYEDMDDYCYVYMLKQNQGAVGKQGKFLFNPELMRMTPVIDDDDTSSEQSEEEY